MRTRLFVLLAASVAAFAPPSMAEIYRCQSAAGTSYQQVPCGDETRGGLAGIATEYPPANAEERDRLLQREEAMNRRLEAERARWSQEAIARQVAARPQPEAAQPETVFVPVFAGVQPVRRWQPRVHPSRGTQLLH